MLSTRAFPNSLAFCITIRAKESFKLLIPIAMHRSLSRLFIDDEEVRAHLVSKQTSAERVPTS